MISAHKGIFLGSSGTNLWLFGGNNGQAKAIGAIVMVRNEELDFVAGQDVESGKLFVTNPLRVLLVGVFGGIAAVSVRAAYKAGLFGKLKVNPDGALEKIKKGSSVSAAAAPDRILAPCSRAWTMNSSCSQVFPIPASPETSRVEPSPFMADARQVFSRDSSRSRPTRP